MSADGTCEKAVHDDRRGHVDVDADDTQSQFTNEGEYRFTSLLTVWLTYRYSGHSGDISLSDE